MGLLDGILGHVGGEGSLGKYAGLLDQDGDGNVLNEITRIAGKLFDKN